MPHHVGIPIGGRNGPKYYMLEIHYDNPKAKRGKHIFLKQIFECFINYVFIACKNLTNYIGATIKCTK